MEVEGEKLNFFRAAQDDDTSKLKMSMQSKKTFFFPVLLTLTIRHIVIYNAVSKKLVFFTVLVLKRK